jgi:hypothetical protein
LLVAALVAAALMGYSEIRSSRAKISHKQNTQKTKNISSWVCAIADSDILEV